MMQSKAARIAVEQFILDCSEVSLRINSIGSTDGRAALVSALDPGRLEYEELLRRADALTMTIADRQLVQVIRIDCRPA
jgi:hypothetical protein